MLTPAYDRAIETVGNAVHLEHVNVKVPDQHLATLFYVSGLGLTRDPYLMTGINNMWINIGRSQFHLPTGKPQVLRGVTGLVVPERAALLRRLSAVAGDLAETRFAVRETETYVEVTCPWGNRVRCHAPAPEFGPIQLGLAYVALDVPRGSADGIARFYRDFLLMPAETGHEEGGAFARVAIGLHQALIFRETGAALPPFDGHHVQIYIADFAGPYRRLGERELISEESDQHQYRFETLIDPASGAALFTLEHEVRSLRHPLYNRTLVNRDPVQTNQNYRPGRDALPWSLPR